jgi:para-aminobenzoate synthetase / 4-amino-4-deoxychorismate lyase
MRQRALPPVVLMSDGALPRGRLLKFDQPQRLLEALRPEEVLPCLQEADAALAKGYHVAGYLSYEAALGLDRAFKASRAYAMPLVWLGVFSTPTCADLPPPHALSCPLQWRAELSPQEYQAALGSIRARIAAGATYQANLTFRLWSFYAGEPWELFCFLYHNQPSSCCAYVDTGRWAICSASPELFFALEGSTLTVRPMKGTLRRGRWPDEDKRFAKRLQSSEKDRAENVMVVDLARNDLGRICKAGSVQVPRLFEVERHPTLLQMTSTVTGSTDAAFSQICAALFPCGSITGAPKVETMRIIARTERSPREVYTGSIGYMTPGRRARFNVAIRTVIVDKRTGAAQCGVGSGITWDSSPGQEYEECLLKSRFTAPPRLPAHLLETLRWEPQAGFALLKAHLCRLARSARFFNFGFDAHLARAKLEAGVANAARVPLKVRLWLAPSGDFTVEAVPLAADPLPRPARVRFATLPVDKAEPMLFHKTADRALYRRLLDLMPDCYDVLLWNQEAFVTELTRFNVLVCTGGRWQTPPIEQGLLRGTLCQALLRGRLVEQADLTKHDVSNAQAIAAINSVRGLVVLRPEGADGWFLEPMAEDSERDPVFRPLMAQVRRLMNWTGV